MRMKGGGRPARLLRRPDLERYQEAVTQEELDLPDSPVGVEELHARAAARRRPYQQLQEQQERDYNERTARDIVLGRGLDRRRRKKYEFDPSQYTEGTKEERKMYRLRAAINKLKVEVGNEHGVGFFESESELPYEGDLEEAFAPYPLDGHQQEPDREAIRLIQEWHATVGAARRDAEARRRAAFAADRRAVLAASSR